MTAHVDPGQPVDPEGGGPGPGVRAAPHTGHTVMATVPCDLSHTHCPLHSALLQAGVITSQPGHSARPTGLPLLGVPLVRQLGPGLTLEPVPALLQI